MLKVDTIDDRLQLSMRLELDNRQINLNFGILFHWLYAKISISNVKIHASDVTNLNRKLNLGHPLSLIRLIAERCSAERGKYVGAQAAND